MTYVRLTGGRDRGHVKDVNFPDAQEMLALGQALPVNFDEKDPLGYKELPAASGQLPETKTIETQTLGTAVLGDVVVADPEPLPAAPEAASVPPVKPAGRFRRGR